mmetsp:Transcript_10773/g.26383  ORF Transcript_10773/g.26383 Transcript_10773/m.26383 type:complete len:333 (-) Transcript_10773:388-1386(-)
MPRLKNILRTLQNPLLSHDSVQFALESLVLLRLELQPLGVTHEFRPLEHLHSLGPHLLPLLVQVRFELADLLLTHLQAFQVVLLLAAHDQGLLTKHGQLVPPLVRIARLPLLQLLNLGSQVLDLPLNLLDVVVCDRWRVDDLVDLLQPHRLGVDVCGKLLHTHHRLHLNILLQPPQQVLPRAVARRRLHLHELLAHLVGALVGHLEQLRLLRHAFHEANLLLLLLAQRRRDLVQLLEVVELLQLVLHLGDLGLELLPLLLELGNLPLQLRRLRARSPQPLRRLVRLLELLLQLCVLLVLGLDLRVSKHLLRHVHIDQETRQVGALAQRLQVV